MFRLTPVACRWPLTLSSRRPSFNWQIHFRALRLLRNFSQVVKRDEGFEYPIPVFSMHVVILKNSG
jgi:hypothetical protein